MSSTETIRSNWDETCLQAKYDHTISVRNVTHVTFGGKMIPTEELETKYGLTYEQMHANRAAFEQRQVQCVLGKTALTLEQFESLHPHIVLGQE